MKEGIKGRKLTTEEPMEEWRNVERTKIDGVHVEWMQFYETVAGSVRGVWDVR